MGTAFLRITGKTGNSVCLRNKLVIGKAMGIARQDVGSIEKAGTMGDSGVCISGSLLFLTAE